jgi:hypothetical protein
VESVLQLGLDLDATAVAEALWLAATTPIAPGMANTALLPPPPGTGRAAHSGGDGGQRPPAREGIDLDEAADPEPSTGPPAALQKGPGKQVRLRQARTSPDQVALGRALRPLKHRWPRGRRTELDLEATVEAYAYTNRLLPKFRPAQEPWFDVLLIIDDSPGMALWEDTVSRLARVLEQLGAFGHLREQRICLTREGSVLRNPRNDQVSSRLVNGPSRRTLVLVVTDGSDTGWRRPEVWRLIRSWATACPTALITPIPARLWGRSGLDLPTVRVSPSTTGSANADLRFTVPHLLRDREQGGWLPVPIASITPHALRQLATTVMRRDTPGCDALLVPRTGRPGENDGPASDADLTASFRQFTSPAALHLAALCALIPDLTVPLITLIREEVVPEATQEDVTELIVSGLLMANGAALAFHDDVRRELLSLVGESDAWRVYDALDSRIVEQTGDETSFLATIYDPAGDPAVPAPLRPLVTASRDVLAALGALTPGRPDPPTVRPSVADADTFGQVPVPWLRGSEAHLDDTGQIVPWYVDPFQPHSTATAGVHAPRAAALGPRSADDVHRQIKAFTSTGAVAPGEAIDFHITVDPPQEFAVDIYRIGHYGGDGAAKITTSPRLSGIVQPAPLTADRTVSCHHWWLSWRLQIPSYWNIGAYVAVLTTADGYRSHVPFTVRDNHLADLLLVLPDVTWQAYNLYPEDGRTGASLYHAWDESGRLLGENDAATTVSFDRPYAGAGLPLHVGHAYDFIRWAERYGYDVAYADASDLHAGRVDPTRYRGLVFPGPDKYWSMQMRQAVEDARDHGTSLVFLSANSMYWQAELTPSPSGVPNRLLTCRKRQGPGPPVLWREIDRSEQEVIGIQYAGQVPEPYPLIVRNAAHWLWEATGVHEGDEVEGLVAGEADRYFPRTPLPDHEERILLAHSPYTDKEGTLRHQETSLYRAPSGAWVFASGTLAWSPALDRPGHVDPRVQRATANLLDHICKRS